MSEKVGVKNYLISYLLNTEVVIRQDKQVVRMMVLLLARIAKLSWLDDVDIKNELVPRLSEILIKSSSDEHKLIGLQAIDQLIVEMTYMTKMKNLQINRRVSLSFRDCALGTIYQNNLEYLKFLLEKFNNEFNQNSPKREVTANSL